MRRKIVIIIAYIILTVLCGAIVVLPIIGVYPQPSEEWSKSIGGWDWDFAYFVEQTDDGGYIIVGYTESFGAGAEDVYLVKTNAGGRQLWRKTFGGPDEDYGYSVHQTTDGGYIIVGETWSFGEGGDVYLIKTDSKGNELWSKTFGGLDEDYGFFVQQTEDGGYIIVGETWSFGENGDVYLIKTDSDGNKMWSKFGGGSGYDSSWTVQQTADGGYIIAGHTSSFSGSDHDAYLIKTDPEGDWIWEKTFGDSGYDEFIFGQQTTDGGYIMVGDTEIGTDVYDVYLVKTDSEGNELWSNTFGGANNDFGHSVQQTTDGGYIIVGDTEIGTDVYDVYLIKTDSEGDELWSKTFGGSDDDTGWCVKQTTDGGYIIAGETWDDSKDDVNVYLIKFAPESESTPSPTSSPSPTPENGGRCIIATTTYGSELSPEVQFLRGFRDNYVLNTYAGNNFMKAFNAWYYSFSPEVASVIAPNNALRGIMKILLYPLIGILHITATTYSLFSLYQELSIIVCGLVASSLIGIIYISPLGIILHFIKKVKINSRTLHVGSIIWGLSIGGMVAAEATRWSAVMMFSTATFVVITMILATLITVKYVTKYIQHLS